VEFDLNYDFSAPGETSSMKFVVVLPTSIPGRQKILSRKYSPKPSRIFNENGNRYAEFILEEPTKHEKVKICVKARLYSYDYSLIKGGPRREDLAGESFDDFLREERYIESEHDKIRQVARGIKGDTDIEVVKKMYDYILDHMHYVIRGREDKGALAALQQGRGDCTEYADLLVAMCRARDIPARVVTGYSVQADTATSKHNWAEVFLNGRGWVPLDPASGDKTNPAYRDMTFGRMPPVYVYLTHVRNDYVLDYHNFGTFKYWGDKVRLTDSVEFRFPAPSAAHSR
jgi:transglutaminase-like putative cysteine protease